MTTAKSVSAASVNTLHHYRSPCVHCGTLMENVAPGPCPGDPAKAVPMAWCGLGVRWDGVEHFRIQYSDDRIVDRWEHVSERLPYGYLNGARHDLRLRSEAT